MPRKKDTITLSIPPGTKEQLEAIALRLQIMWGKSPSISGLLVAIAQGEYELGEPFKLNDQQIQALDRAVGLLVDTGKIAQAQTLVQLLLERGDLNPPLRQKMMQQMTQSQVAWRVQAEQQIQKQEPFLVNYGNPQGEIYTYNVRYAQIDFFEKRYYLDIWCDETEDIKDTKYPELIHIRCLRLDRIQSLVPLPGGEWRREGLNTVEVQLHFYNGLIKSYESKENDIEDETVDGLRRVTRRVFNTFWLLREVRRYGSGCEVISPEALRQQAREDAQAVCDRYNR